MCFGLILSHEQVNQFHYRCTTVFHIVIFNSKIKKIDCGIKDKGKWRLNQHFLGER